ncbi:MAG TPA: serine/threonine-protein kinase [Sandaracinaceae bacterium LLY-WYZ-13_1]|nr:serine/threonine-protein kinase [Sandaracinaceae bacterium LLY-WYZ-13_1]
MATRRSTAYLPVEEIARGGMGTVELVLRREGSFERLYALKRLLPALREDTAVRRMFLEEARVAGLLRHPNVVSVLDVGEDARGPFLVMDYVDGVSLARLVSDIAPGDYLPLGVCFSLLRQIAEGLHAAHELRDHESRPLELVHRDVSPQNVLVGYDGVARVTDFGIAKALGRQTTTTVGLLKGKAGYLSPEQLRFERLDRRSDLFSLGVLAFEVLAGRRLYAEEELADVAQRILHEPPPDVGELRGDVPDELVALLFDLLSKDPDHRPDTAAEVATALAALEAGLPADEPSVVAFTADRYGAEREALRRKRAKAVERAKRMREARSRGRWWRAAGAGAVAAALALAGWALVETNAETAPAPAVRTDTPTRPSAPLELEPAPQDLEPSTRGPEAVAPDDGSDTRTAEAPTPRRAARPRRRATRRERTRVAPAAPSRPGEGEVRAARPEGRSTRDERLWGWP